MDKSANIITKHKNMENFKIEQFMSKCMLVAFYTNKQYFLEDYIDMIPLRNSKFGLRYYKQLSKKEKKELLGRRFISYILRILQEIGIKQIQVNYKIPNNELVKTYFPCDVTFNSWEGVVTDSDKLSSKFGIDKYVEFYQIRWDKVPLLRESDDPSLELNHEWVTEIIFSV